MASDSDFESWLDRKISTLKGQGSLKSSDGLSLESKSTESMQSRSNWAMEALRRKSKEVDGYNRTATVTTQRTESKENPGDYYKFTWNAEDDTLGVSLPGNQMSPVQTKFASRFSAKETVAKILKETEPAHAGDIMGGEEYLSFSRLTSSVEEDEDEYVTFSQPPRVKQRSVDSADKSACLDWDYESNELEERRFSESSEDEHVFGEGDEHRGRADGESPHLFSSTQGSPYFAERDRQMTNFDQVLSQRKTPFFHGHRGESQTVPVSPQGQNRIILPMETIEMSLDSSDEDVEMLDPTLSLDSVDLGSDSRPIVTLDQAELAEQWARKWKKIRIGLIISGLVTSTALFGLITYLVVHFM